MKMSIEIIGQFHNIAMVGGLVDIPHVVTCSNQSPVHTRFTDHLNLWLIGSNGDGTENILQSSTIWVS